MPIHFFVTVPMILMFLIHFYLTTIGTKGAFRGIFYGTISRTEAAAPAQRRGGVAGGNPRHAGGHLARVDRLMPGMKIKLISGPVTG